MNKYLFILLVLAAARVISDTERKKSLKTVCGPMLTFHSWNIPLWPDKERERYAYGCVVPKEMGTFAVSYLTCETPHKAEIRTVAKLCTEKARTDKTA